MGNGGSNPSLSADDKANLSTIYRYSYSLIMLDFLMSIKVKQSQIIPN